MISPVLMPHWKSNVKYLSSYLFFITENVTSTQVSSCLILLFKQRTVFYGAQAKKKKQHRTLYGINYVVVSQEAAIPK
jgi:hypothetical protein